MDATTALAEQLLAPSLPAGSRASPVATTSQAIRITEENILWFSVFLHHKAITKLTRPVAGGPREDRVVDDALTSLPIVPVRTAITIGLPRPLPFTSASFTLTQLTSLTLDSLISDPILASVGVGTS